jgi:hypothetical protein
MGKEQSVLCQGPTVCTVSAHLGCLRAAIPAAQLAGMGLRMDGQLHAVISRSPTRASLPPGVWSFGSKRGLLGVRRRPRDP